jgi:hypothetical protein
MALLERRTLTSAGLNGYNEESYRRSGLFQLAPHDGFRLVQAPMPGPRRQHTTPKL